MVFAPIQDREVINRVVESGLVGLQTVPEAAGDDVRGAVTEGHQRELSGIDRLPFRLIAGDDVVWVEFPKRLAEILEFPQMLACPVDLQAAIQRVPWGSVMLGEHERSAQRAVHAKGAQDPHSDKGRVRGQLGEGAEGGAAAPKGTQPSEQGRTDGFLGPRREQYVSPSLDVGYRSGKADVDEQASLEEALGEDEDPTNGGTSLGIDRPEKGRRVVRESVVDELAVGSDYHGRAFDATFHEGVISQDSVDSEERQSDPFTFTNPGIEHWGVHVISGPGNGVGRRTGPHRTGRAARATSRRNFASPTGTRFTPRMRGVNSRWL